MGGDASSTRGSVCFRSFFRFLSREVVLVGVFVRRASVRGLFSVFSDGG